MARVLVVDDEPGMGETLRDILTDEGHEVTVAERGARAVELLRQDAELDVVLLDMRMPDMSGAEVFRQLRQLHPELKVVTMTGYSPDDLLAEVEAGGIYATLTKPMDIPRLLELIREAGASD